MSDAKTDKLLEGGDVDSSVNNHRSNIIHSNSSSSADHVEQHLLGLEVGDSKAESLSILEDEEFSEDELSKVVNVKRLQALLQQSDAFMAYLTGEMDDFDN